MMSVDGEAGRLAELAIALSLASDLGTGQPLEHGLRTCLLSLSAGRALGLDGPQLSSVFHVALLRFIGCTSDASEIAVAAGGDDVALNATMAPMLTASPADGLRFVVRHLGEGLPWLTRAGLVGRALADPGFDRRSLSGHCEVGARLVARLGAAPSIGRALAHAYERWDGRGYPNGLAGEDVPVEIRVVTVARDVEMWARHGWATAAGVLAQRRGRGYDPQVVDVFLSDGRHWLAEAGDDLCAQVLDAEPLPISTLDAVGLDAALAAVGDFADMKSPWFRGRSASVSALAAGAADVLGLAAGEARLVARAGLVLDVGRVGIAAAIWDRPGPLTAEQWERVRLHPYLTERVLGRCSLLAPLAPVAGRHHERADGSGYHRGLTAPPLGVADQILAAADCYQAMIEARPHRAPLAPESAAATLRDEARAGRLNARVVDGLLLAAGQTRHPITVARPANLTEREVDVLRLLARGHSNRAIASQLAISPKTVGRHVEHIYGKAGVRTRAGATLFAVEAGLLDRS